jgi:multidrug efflux system outer membrane protein
LDGNFSGSTGIGGTFDPDLNGRTAARIASVQAALESSALNTNDVRRLITRAVALQYIEFRRASARLALLESTLELQERTLQIVESRYRAGLSPKLDVDRTQADYARTAAQRSQIIAARRQAEFEIQRLMGEPSALDQITNPDRETIPQIQFVSDIGIPADLVRRRPDVRAAEADYRSALALIDAERADLLPSIRIPGQIQAGFGDVSGRADEIGYSLSALVDIPVFDFGRRQAEVDIQIARTELAALTYRATLLDALQEVEIALVNIEAIQETLEGQLRAVEASQAAYDQLDALYREGLASFIDVLDSQRTLISSRETIVQTEANLAAATVSLLAALDAGCEETGIVACEGE